MNQRYDNSGNLITTKSTDDALVERARRAYENGDKSMKAVLEWDERGRKPKKRGTDAHHSARHRLERLKEEYSVDALAEAYHTNYGAIYNLLKANYRDVSHKVARRIAGADPEKITRPEPAITKDDYKKAQKILREEYEGETTYQDLAKKYDMPWHAVSNIARDKYVHPNKRANKVLEHHNSTN